MRRLTLISVEVLMAIIPGVVVAAPGDLISELMPPTPEERTLCGLRVSGLGQNSVLVACPASGNRLAKVYLYDGLTAELLQTFPNPKGDSDDGFGRSIASVGEDKVVVGAPNVGMAYVFDVATGDLLHELAAPYSLGRDAALGTSVAGVGGFVAVAAARTWVGLYDAETGEFVREIPRPSGDTSAYGESLAAYGDDLLVTGISHGPIPGPGVGAGYRFDPTTGDLLATYADPAPQTRLFGTSIGGDSGYVAIGAPHEGNVFLYDADTGDLVQTLSRGNVGFGITVDVTSSGLVLVGANSTPPESFLFDAETGDMLHSYDQGYVVAAVRSKVLIGSPHAHAVSHDSGMAVLYEGETLAGDMDEDGQVNGLDVDPFVDAVLNNPFYLYGDMNGDGVVTGLDVDPFVAILLGGGAEPIPEPSTLLLCIIALGVVGGWWKWGE